MTAVRFLPLGVFAFATAMLSPMLPRYVHPRWIILAGLALTFIATVLFPFASEPRHYFPLLFPAFVLGTSGASMMYTSTNIAIFRGVTPEIAGTVGAVFNAALQLGGAIGVAIFTSIQTSVDAKTRTRLGEAAGDMIYVGYNGRAAAWWFVLGAIGLAMVGVAVFYRVDEEQNLTPPSTTGQGQGS